MVIIKIKKDENMKISKDSHKRMAVVIHDNMYEAKKWESKTIGQIKPCDKELKEYVEGRAEKVKFLYKVLGISANSNLDKQMSKDVLFYFNSFMDYILKIRLKKNVNLDIESKKITEYLQNGKSNSKKVRINKNEFQNIEDINLDITNEFAHKLVMLHLRGSLKKEVKIINSEKKVYIPDFIEKLVLGVCRENNFEDYMRQIPAEEIQACMEVILQDYTKEKWIDEIVKSVENQDVKAQVFGEGKECCIKIASAEHESKKYIFQFMVDYACGTKQSREEMLRVICKLMILFLCGPEAYGEVKKQEISLWKFSSFFETIPDTPQVFEVECEKLLLERDNLKNLPKEEKSSVTKQRIKDIDVEAKRKLRREVTFKYCKANETLKEEFGSGEEYNKQRFWLEYIEHETEKQLLLKGKKQLSINKIYAKWLYEAVWKNFIAFMASKFVDQGKAVYHFAMPDLHQINDGQKVKIGTVLPQYQDGITSFDYERITAEERLERRFIVSIMSAINNYASAVCPDSVYEGKGNVEDILQFSGNELVKKCYTNAGWRLMQFFGGYSQWEGVLNAGNVIRGEGKNQFVREIQEALKYIRNSSFHYSSACVSKSLKEDSVLVWIFEREKEGVGALIRKKYYSNNVPMFYSVKNIDLLMNRIHRKEVVLESQIPSFQSIMGWKDYMDNLTGLIDSKAYAVLQKDADITKIFHNSFYFILKELYYRCFLQENDLTDRFERILKNEVNREKANRKNERKSTQKELAILNFQKRLTEYKKQNSKIKFGELCQLVMTDYNLQNTQKKVRNNRNSKLPEPKYEHFKMLLLECTRKEFVEYVKEEIIGKQKEGEFLRTPRFKDTIIGEKEFCNSWKTVIYEELENDKDNMWMISWFIVSHFMNPKQLNHLKGTIKGYLSYISGIENRRCASMNMKNSKENRRQRKSIKEKEEQYKKLLKVLDLASEYCGKISSKWEDYYETEEEYAENIKQYLAYENREVEISLKSQLLDFCNKKVTESSSGYIGMFYDGNRPIVNRNVVQAKLYGTEKLIARCLGDDRITEWEIREYYKQAKKLNAVFKAGKCENIKQEQERRKYQQMKNRIELVDILKYSEILNDLMSQLISWCYLRERDRMYFQIGLHYIRLYYGNHIVSEDSKFRVLRGKSGNEESAINIIDGAVLYQLAAVYTYELPVYTLDKEGYAIVSKKAPAGTLTSNGVTGFCREYCEKDLSVYEAGLELFESPSEEKVLIDFRNYIDHFKYFSRRDASVLELYSKMYASFFRHDTKLKKSVTVTFQNILARHFVLASINMLYIEDVEKKNKRVSHISVKSLDSEVTVHKYEEKQANGKTKHVTKKLDYYDQRFLNRLNRILEYNRG